MSCPRCVRINAAGERLDRLITACHWIARRSSAHLIEFALSALDMRSAFADFSRDQQLVLDHLAATVQTSAAVDREMIRRCANDMGDGVAVASPARCGRRPPQSSTVSAASCFLVGFGKTLPPAWTGHPSRARRDLPRADRIDPRSR
jgi:hypothetical protein